MAKNYLKLKESKTDFMIIGSKHNLPKLSTTHITIGNESVASSACIKNIGAHLDNTLKMEMQISQMCKKAWYNLYQIRKIKKYLMES